METNIEENHWLNLINCIAIFFKEDPTGSKNAFCCIADGVYPHRFSFLTLAEFIYFKCSENKNFIFKIGWGDKNEIHTAQKKWQSIYLGKGKHQVTIALGDVGDSIYVWPGFHKIIHLPLEFHGISL